MAGRPLAKAAGIGKGISQGIASFMDFKRSFEDAVRKNKWEKEREESERIEKRYMGMRAEGYRESPEDTGMSLAGGYPQLSVPTPGEAPPGMIRVPEEGTFIVAPKTPEEKAEKERIRREEWEQERIEGRYTRGEKLGGSLDSGDMGRFVKGENVPMTMLPEGEGVPAPEGYEEVPKGKKYVKKLSKKPTKWEIRKEARTTVNSMLDDNYDLQMKVYENPGLLDELIDRQVERLEKYYLKGKKIPKPPAKRKNPYKQWYPDAYWSEEYGSWVIKKRGDEYKLVE